MTTLGRARQIALALPEATEQDHHGMASFRVRGKIFATVPDHQHIRIMLSENEIRASVAEHPDVCGEAYWGKKLTAVVVELAAVRLDVLRELLTDAWLGKAPRSLVREFFGEG
jgi:hypothetical protein